MSFGSGHSHSGRCGLSIAGRIAPMLQVAPATMLSQFMEVA